MNGSRDEPSINWHGETTVDTSVKSIKNQEIEQDNMMPYRSLEEEKQAKMQKKNLQQIMETSGIAAQTNGSVFTNSSKSRQQNK